MSYSREKLIAKVLEKELGILSNKSEPVAKKVCETLTFAEHGYDETVRLTNEMMRYESEQEKVVTQFKERRKAIQAKCRHPSTTYHPDPSGGNDSHTTCDICGKEL